MKVRHPAVAGAFYPADPKELKRMIGDFLASANPPPLTGRLRALIVPHAGYIYSGPVAAAGYALIINLKFEIKNFILLGPAHTVGFAGAAVSTAKEWKTPLGDIPAWRPQAIAPPLLEFDLAHLHEHCLEVQLPFLQIVLNRQFQILPIVTGEANPEELSFVLEKIAGEEDLLIISSDLSHYHTYSTAQDLDHLTIKAILRNQITVLETQGEACGILSILSLLSLARRKGWQAQLLDYRNSGDTAGDKSRVVGYAAIAFSD